MKLKHWAIAVLFVAGVAVAPSAEASVVTYKIDFLATGFQNFGVPAPQATVAGEFTLTFDTARTYVDATSGVTLNRLNVPLNSTLGFDFYSSFIQIGGLEHGVSYVDPAGGNDFDLSFKIDPLVPLTVVYPEFFYREASPIGGTYSTTDVSVSVSPVDNTGPQPVPEPPGWALLLVGALGVGLAPCWRKREGGGGGGAGWVALATRRLGKLPSVMGCKPNPEYEASVRAGLFPGWASHGSRA